MDRAGWLLTLT